jgi:hypothetical protein
VGTRSVHFEFKPKTPIRANPHAMDKDLNITIGLVGFSFSVFGFTSSDFTLVFFFFSNLFFLIFSVIENEDKGNTQMKLEDPKGETSFYFQFYYFSLI